MPRHLLQPVEQVDPAQVVELLARQPHLFAADPVADGTHLVAVLQGGGVEGGAVDGAVEVR